MGGKHNKQLYRHIHLGKKSVNKKRSYYVFLEQSFLVEPTWRGPLQFLVPPLWQGCSYLQGISEYLFSPTRAHKLHLKCMKQLHLDILEIHFCTVALSTNVRSLFLWTDNSSYWDLRHLEGLLMDLALGPGRLTRRSRGLAVVCEALFCTGPQQPGSEVCVGESEQTRYSFGTVPLIFTPKHCKFKWLLWMTDWPEGRMRWRKIAPGSQGTDQGGSLL